MFEAMTLAMKMSEVLKTVDKNIQYLADQIDASTFCARSPILGIRVGRNCT